MNIRIFVDGRGEREGPARRDGCVRPPHVQHAQVTDQLHRLLHQRHVRRMGW